MPRLCSWLCFVAFTAVAFSGCSHDESIPPPKASTGAAQGPGDVQDQLEQFSRAVTTGDPALEERIEVPGSTLVRDISSNAHRLRIRSLRVRDIDATTSADASRFGARAQVEAVEISYLLPQDLHLTDFETNVVFVPGPGQSWRIADVGAAGARGALWLEGPVTVRRAARLLLIVSDARDLDHYWPLAEQALRDVDAVETRWHGTLVFEVPSDQRQLEELIDAPTGSYDLIAGVTAVVDGSTRRQAAIHSFFNTNLMSGEGHSGAQLVVSHEATLQATRAPLSPMPIWMEEGFADYVALKSAHLPLRQTAKELAAQIRKSGTPDHLPTETDFDFDPAAHDLGSLNAVYESAWLACRYIASRWSEATLLAAYRELDRDVPEQTVFSRVLSEPRSRFVTGWRQYLSRVAAGTR